MSVLDVGQGVVIQEKIVLAIEAIEGTDNMIKRTESLVRDGTKPVLIKMLKIGQTRKVDLPTIGVDTITNVAESGFAGISLSGNGIIIINKDDVINKANELGVFIIIN